MRDSILVLALAALMASTGAGVAAAGDNLALHRPTTGSPICKPGEEAHKAVDGLLSSKTEHKFCTLQQPAWLRIDLQSRRRVQAFVIKHAGAGGEAAAMNTRAYTLSLSDDGKQWREVVRVSDNRADVREHTIAPTFARYVRLDVSQPAQDPADPATRIYEVEVR